MKLWRSCVLYDVAEGVLFAIAKFIVQFLDDLGIKAFQCRSAMWSETGLVTRPVRSQTNKNWSWSWSWSCRLRSLSWSWSCKSGLGLGLVALVL